MYEVALHRPVGRLSGGVRSWAAVGKSCKADIKRFCADEKSGKRGADCLKSHAADLSSGCKDAMAKVEAGNK